MRSRATATAQIVALADKLDTLRGCFRVGLIPTGSRDPFALRRAAQGVVKILVEGRLELPLLDADRRRRRAARLLRRPRPATTSGHSRLRLRRSQRPHGGRLEQPGGSGSAPGSACRACAQTPDFEPLAASFQAHQEHSEQAEVHRRRARSTRALLEARPGAAICTTSSGAIAGPADRERRSRGCGPRSICSSTRFW